MTRRGACGASSADGSRCCGSSGGPAASRASTAGTRAAPPDRFQVGGSLGGRRGGFWRVGPGGRVELGIRASTREALVRELAPPRALAASIQVDASSVADLLVDAPCVIRLHESPTIHGSKP